MEADGGYKLEGENLFAKFIINLPSWLRPDQYEFIKNTTKYALAIIEAKVKYNSDASCLFAVGTFICYLFSFFLCSMIISALRFVLYKIIGRIHNRNPTVYALKSVKYLMLFLVGHFLFISLSFPIWEFYNVPAFYFIFFLIQTYFVYICEIDYEIIAKDQRKKDNLTMSEKVLDFFKNILDMAIILIPSFSIGIKISIHIFSLMPLIVPHESHLQNNGINMNTSRAVLLYFILAIAFNSFISIWEKIVESRNMIREILNKKKDSVMESEYNEAEGMASVGGIIVESASFNGRKRINKHDEL